MATPVVEFEGTWEEIVAHAAELAGRRVRLTVLPAPADVGPKRPPPSPANERMLELLSEWEQTPLTDEEIAVLDGLEQHLKDQPFSLREVENDR